MDLLSLVPRMSKAKSITESFGSFEPVEGGKSIVRDSRERIR